MIVASGSSSTAVVGGIDVEFDSFGLSARTASMFETLITANSAKIVSNIAAVGLGREFVGADNPTVGVLGQFQTDFGLPTGEFVQTAVELGKFAASTLYDHFFPSKEAAISTVVGEIARMRSIGAHYAADLLQHFLANTGQPFVPSATNVVETKSHGAALFGKMIAAEYDKIIANTVFGLPSPVGVHTIDIDHLIANGPNTRWYDNAYLNAVGLGLDDDENMFLAFGGAAVSINTQIEIFEIAGPVGPLLDWKIVAPAVVKVQDVYNFDVHFLKRLVSSAYSKAYAAALYLQQTGCNPSFEHEINFTYEVS